MRKHVDHLLTAYVHDQLSRKDRDRVAVHVRLCGDCRDALRREAELAQDVSRYLPRIGEPKRGQLARLWPSIWREFRTPPGLRYWPSYGLVLALMVLGAFVLSSLFTGPTHAIAAPFQAVPAEVRATVTPVRTDEPVVDLPTPNETANALLILPMASPAPHVESTRPVNMHEYNGQ